MPNEFTPSREYNEGDRITVSYDLDDGSAECTYEFRNGIFVLVEDEPLLDTEENQ
jgi:hypothetical protein